METQRRWQRKLNLVAAGIPVFVALFAGTAIFAVMMKRGDELMRQSLLASVQRNVAVMQSEVGRAVRRSQVVATRPFLISQLDQLDRHPGDSAAEKNLARGIQSFVSTGFAGLALRNRRGLSVASAGRFVGGALLSIPLHFKDHPRLFWDHGFFLHVTMPVRNGRRVIGSLVAEVPLRALDRMFPGARELGSTANLALCAPAKAGMSCFPTTRRPDRVITGNDRRHGSLLPVARTFSGQTGTRIGVDYDGRPVVAAYSPVGKFGLGMALKVDRKELLMPFWHEWTYVSVLVVVVLGLAFLMLRWLFNPLVRKVTESERRMRRAARHARHSEGRTRTVLEHIDAGILTVSEDGTIDLFNRGAEEMFGYPEGEAVGKHIGLLIPEPFCGASRITALNQEMIAVHRDGHPFPIDLRLSEVSLAGTRQFIGIMRDISERQAVEHKIHHMATHDTLTGLPNRDLFRDRVQQAVEHAKRSRSVFSVMFMDLDQFKSVNDSLGHSAGDALLKVVAGRLKECLRAEDTVSRQGGDEFTVLLASLSEPADAGIVAAKILSVVSAPYVIEGRELRVGASIGIAVYPGDGDSVDDLLKNSDSAMYHAKEIGRGTHCFFMAELNAAAGERLRIESGLRDAIEQGQLVLHYQPIVRVSDNQIESVEALIRWNRPGLGVVPPDQFISVAEASGLIIPIGQWILRHSCEQINQWDERGLAVRRVAINISPRELRERDFFENFVCALREAGVSPDRIGLELTENMMLEDSNIPVGILHKLKALGVELSLDDFGTGYSNLAYLKRLSIDKLKIDRSFIGDLGKDSANDAMVQAIMGIARHLQIKIVAEGVETAEQLAFLNSHGCDQYQGYYFSRPLPAEEIRTVFSARTAAVAPFFWRRRR
ncbi:MAG: bifunctional diguanylate cyclase/phosphodiesterase [Acidiferrobacteraceae bacterium]